MYGIVLSEFSIVDRYSVLDSMKTPFIMKTRSNSLHRLRVAMGTVAIATMGFALQSMTAAPAPAEEAAPKYGKSVYMNWPHETKCQVSMRVMFALAEFDCNEPPPRICIVDEICETFNVGTGSIFVPNAGTILSVELICGEDCSGTGSLVYECNGANAPFECCSSHYWVTGSLDPVSGDVTLSM